MEQQLRSSGRLQVWLANVSAVTASAESWFALRDQKQAARAYREALDYARESGITRDEAKFLERVLPPQTTRILIERTDRCIAEYNKIMQSREEYLPNELDDATEAVMKCICRELSRIHRLTGSFRSLGVMDSWWKQWCT
jgi:hypothetical protein